MKQLTTEEIIEEFNDFVEVVLNKYSFHPMIENIQYSGKISKAKLLLKISGISYELIEQMETKLSEIKDDLTKVVLKIKMEEIMTNGVVKFKQRHWN